jgi:phosphoribosylformylglycinamidine synthase I|tara:strand:- start:2730 stop:3422 length:693 start_codon:yes stop_codon:yes gene_type:complete
MRFGVSVFPGTWSDVDCYSVINDVLGYEVDYVWHKETDIDKYDCIVIPGGFSYGDYLRCGSIASLSPIMNSIKDFALQGGLVLGICNGFQILCESGLLPGALIRNSHLQFRCQWVNLRVENEDSVFTRNGSKGQVVEIPISHGEGNYYADPETLEKLENNDQVLFRYCDQKGYVSPESNPNGSVSNIAGIVNETGNVLGMMPHPERCCDELIGGVDGKFVFESIISSIKR